MTQRKMTIIASFLILSTVFLLSSCGEKDSSATSQQTTKKAVRGPMVDKIFINTKMRNDLGLKDTAEGISDVYWNPVSGTDINALDKETLDKMELYTAPSGSWSLFLNPVPNKAPYLVEKDGDNQFNPFAIRDVRYAINYLIDREYIVDEILGGAGGAMLTAATPAQPGTYKYTVLANKLGMTTTSNEERAIMDIDNAFTKAGKLSELKGKLVKEGKWWTFNGSPLSIKFLIRVDEPNGRLIEGHYVADQIEKAGIQVERLLWERSKCTDVVYYGDPLDYEWNIYTEGWLSGGTAAYHDTAVSQMYAPWYGNMPGIGVSENWNYENEKIDELSQKASNGNFLTIDEYWELVLGATEQGLKDAVRIYVCYQNDFYAVNKEVYNKRTPYGLGDGFNRWSVLGSDVKKDELTITCFSSQGSLFMFAWDPVGNDGFSDTYSTNIAELISDPSGFNNPATAEYNGGRVTWSNVQSDVGRDSNGDVVGRTKVPANAVLYNSMTNKWEEVGEGVTAMSSAEYKYPATKFHHDEPNDLTFPLYVGAFRKEWATKDGENDKYFDESMESVLTSSLDVEKGYVFDVKKGTYTSYFDYNFPPSKDQVGFQGMMTTDILNGRRIHVSWEITEALAHMVVNGSASGEVYSFTSSAAGAIEPDIIVENCIKDIRAELENMIKSEHIPESLVGFVTPKEAVQRYQSAIKWIDEKKHAFIGDGPYILDKYEPVTNYMELSAYRDSSYPFMSDKWPKAFETTTVSIDDVEYPATAGLQDELTAKIYVSEVSYPYNIAEIANNAKTTLTIITDSGEIDFPGKKTGDGEYEVKIPANQLKDLDKGIYTILFKADIEGAVSVVNAQSIKFN